MTPALQVKYIARIAEHGGRYLAADEIGVSMSAVRTALRDPDFAAAVDGASERFADALEDALRKRAIEGVDDFVVDKNGDKHWKKRYSDQAATFLLKGARKKKYSDKVDMSVERSMSLDELSDADLARIIKAAEVGG